MIAFLEANLNGLTLYLIEVHLNSCYLQKSRNWQCDTEFIEYSHYELL